MQEKEQDSMYEGGIGLPRGVSGVYRPESGGNLMRSYDDIHYGASGNLPGSHNDPKKAQEPAARQLADPTASLNNLYGNKPPGAA